MGLLYEDLTYKILGCIYAVHNKLGTGYDEESYHLALVHQLREDGLACESKVVRYLEHRGIKVHKFVLDIIVANKVILELKSIQTNFHPAHFAQIIAYFKCWNKQLGYLVNFGLPKAYLKRIIFKEKQKVLYEDYQHINPLITKDNRGILLDVRAAIANVLDIHGLGYGEAIYQKILNEEFTHNNIEFVPSTIIQLKNNGLVYRDFEMKMSLISNQFICGVVAQKDDITYDIIRVQTYLKALNLSIGLLVHFGQNNLTIHGVRA